MVRCLYTSDFATFLYTDSASIYRILDDNYHGEALTEKGILNADSVGNKNYFNPTETVSRLDFVVAAMRVMGVEDDVVCTQTVFDDDSAIPTAYKGYVSLAQQKNYVCGKISEDGRLLFSPNDMITRVYEI